MLSFDWFNFICMIINLLILYFLMKKFLFGRVDKVLKEREKEIEEQYLKAEKKEKDAAELEKEYRDHLAQVTYEGEQVRKDTAFRASIEYNKLISEANKKAEDIISKARKTAKYETERAVLEQEKEMRSLVLSAASKITGSRGASNDKELLDRFIQSSEENNGGGEK